MAPETIALSGGLLFLLIAIVGGGFTIREIIMPRVPSWARVASLVVGVVLIVPFFVAVISPDQSGSTAGPPQPGTSGPSGETLIYSDTKSDVSNDEIEVSGLRATGQQTRPAVGDRIKVEFSLKNVGSETVTFEETFIGARDPAGNNEDFGHSNAGKALPPGDAVEISSSLIVDSAGTWQFWPCYVLQIGNQSAFCPDEWRAFQVQAGQ